MSFRQIIFVNLLVITTKIGIICKLIKYFNNIVFTLAVDSNTK